MLTAYNLGFSAMAVALVFLMVNPFGAMIYILAVLIANPQAPQEFDVVTWLFIVLVLLASLVNHTRG